MRHEVRLEPLGDEVQDAFVAQWFVELNSEISVGEPLVELMTDKANVELSAEVTGVVVEICVDEEGRVAPGDLLAVIEVRDS